MPESAQRSAPASRRRTWDGQRRISAWAGLLELFAVIAVIVTLGGRLTGGEQDRATTWAIVVMLVAPAILAGLVSGSRYFELYAGYARRLDPTAQLSEADSVRGATAASSVIGDAMWGSLIAGVAGAVPATIGLAIFLGPAAVIGLPVFALVVGIAWFTGWVIGAVASLLLSTAAGIVVGARRREGGRGRLPWMLVAALLPVLLVAVVLPAIGVRYADGRVDVWGAILAVIGLPFAGAEFVLGDPLLWVARIAIWLTVVLIAVLVVVGTPALLRRVARG
jgi:hypothetical protein